VNFGTSAVVFLCPSPPSLATLCCILSFFTISSLGKAPPSCSPAVSVNRLVSCALVAFTILNPR